MIEVLVSPAHLAGASIEHARDDETLGTVLTLDRPHPTEPGRIAVAEGDVELVRMSPDQRSVFVRELGKAPEARDVRRALRVVFGDKALPYVKKPKAKTPAAKPA